MKKIIFKKEDLPVIPLDELQGGEAIAYRCQNSENYAVLARVGVMEVENFGTFKANNRLVTLYGFIPLGASQDKPRFVAYNWFEAIKLAGANRKLYVFSNSKEMIKAMAEGKF